MVSVLKYFEVCFLQRLNVISSTLVMCFLGHPEPRGVFRTLSNIYDDAFDRVLFPQKLRHRFLTGP